MSVHQILATIVVPVQEQMKEVLNVAVLLDSLEWLAKQVIHYYDYYGLYKHVIGCIYVTYIKWCLQNNNLEFFDCQYWQLSYFIYLDACSPSPCQNSGNCTGTDGGGFECSCPTGFFGTNCEISKWLFIVIDIYCLYKYIHMCINMYMLMFAK